MTGDLERLIERSRRIGADRELVVHGGGNTSTKTLGRDHLGRERRVLVIKASGADLATIDGGGFAELYLDDLLTIRDALSMADDPMVAFVARCLVRPGVRPSIETLLHAFLPAKDVDHVHADAICALTNTPDPARTVRDALGPGVAYVPYERPGFGLARRVAELAESEAVVLGHHGLVTWSDDGSSYERTVELVRRAADHIAARRRSSNGGPGARPAGDPQAALLKLRGRLSRNERVVLHVGPDRTIADRPDVDRIAAAGPATADHLLHIGPWSLVVASADDVDGAVDAYEHRYAAYWERQRHRAPAGLTVRDARPRVVLVPGLGTVTAGIDERRARIVGDVAARTHAVAAAAIDAFGAAVPLTEPELFDIDYWPLELAKLRPSAPRDHEGRIVIVTGAAGAIGSATAAALARAGAHVVVTDLDRARLDEVARCLENDGHPRLAVHGDISDERFVAHLVSETIARFGGVDAAVSNAGVAVTGRLSEATLADWERSLATNLTSHFLLTRELLRAFSVQGIGGALVYVASKNAFDPGAGFGPYSVAKAGEVQLARLAAIEGGPLGVRANAINPDAIFGNSRLWSDELRRARAAAHGISTDQLESFYAKRNLLGAVVRSEDVASAASFLLSDRASRTTGCVLTVDGGLSAAFPR